MQIDLQEREHLRRSLLYPSVFIGILWVIKLIEWFFVLDFRTLGVSPGKWEGLIGVLTSPLIHGDFEHLLNNSVALFLLGFVVYQSYRKIANELIIWLWFSAGILTWIGGRPSYHIGASGIVYGLAFFVFFSGIFRKDVVSIAMALLIAFFYGSMIWGLLPIQEGVSWEGHLSGALSGAGAAYFFRNIQPAKKFPWELEPLNEEEDIVEVPFWVEPPIDPLPEIELPPNNTIVYHYIPKKDSAKDE